MIKSIHKLLAPKSEADYQALLAFFDALGVMHGESWNGRRSKGVKLDAPEAGVELGIGEGFPNADLVIECDSADMLFAQAQRHKLKVLDEPRDCDWGARMFSLELPAGFGKLAVFSYNENWRNKTIEGDLDASAMKFAVVVSRFNAFITERLLAGTLQALRQSGAKNENVEIVRVPGAYEIPSASRMLAETKKYNAIVCIGCLLRGDTAHYDVIVNEVGRGVGQSAQETGVPHAFGVLTCDTLEQAIDRAGLKMGNKGFEAGLAAVEMASLKKKVVSTE
ncbi:MAG TPA: 6,7-dimethyl-8-ribityllumazine synthase [Terriglobales bacterium]|nr:6,7-dimethyl-8-ribityllumazine synthase [Terriglobales bacterium]